MPSFKTRPTVPVEVHSAITRSVSDGRSPKSLSLRDAALLLELEQARERHFKEDLGIGLSYGELENFALHSNPDVGELPSEKAGGLKRFLNWRAESSSFTASHRSALTFEKLNRFAPSFFETRLSAWPGTAPSVALIQFPRLRKSGLVAKNYEEFSGALSFIRFIPAGRFLFAHTIQREASEKGVPVKRQVFVHAVEANLAALEHFARTHGFEGIIIPTAATMVKEFPLMHPKTALLTYGKLPGHNDYGLVEAKRFKELDLPSRFGVEHKQFWFKRL